MDNYCRTCMRDSNKFSAIFEEMTYGGISLQEAIEDVCQLEISIGDGLSLYVCRDCALKLYDIVRFKMDAHEVYSALRKLMAIHPRMNVENDDSIEEASPSYPEIENMKVEDFCVNHSHEAIHLRINVENDDSIEEASPSYPEIDNIKVEECSVSHSNEVSYNANPDPHGNATISDAWNFEPSQPSVKVENSIRGTDSFEVNIPPGDMQNKFAAVFRDTPELPSIFLVNSESLNPEVIELEDVSLTCSNHHLSQLHDNAEGKGSLASREKYCQSDGTHLPERTEDNEITESGNADSNSMVKQGEGEPVDAISYLSQSSAASVVLDTIENSSVESYICHVCDKDFGKRSVLMDHERIHLVEKQLECEFCCRKFRMEYTLKKHQKIHEICRKSFSSDDRNNIDASHSSEVLQQGSMGELDKFPIQVLHRECENFNKNPTIVIDTNVPLHEGGSIDYPKNFNCDRCTKVFWNKQDLLEHLILHYGQRSCSRLAEVRKTVNHLPPGSDSMNERGTNVFKRNKEENVRLRNKSCGKESVVDCELNIPETVRDSNSAEKPLACKYCSKMFQFPYHLRRHELIHTGEKPYACKYCSKMFQFPYHLRRHELIHTGEKPFACKYCSKMFNTAAYRKTHEMIHTGEKPFSCKLCSQKFTTSSSRNNHELLHSGEKPFPCKVCSKTFTRKCHLNRHELSHSYVALSKLSPLRG